MRALLTAYQVAAYYASFGVFAALALVLNWFCLLASWLPGTDARERFFQRCVHRQFALFIRWLNFSGVVPVRYQGFARRPERGGYSAGAGGARGGNRSDSEAYPRSENSSSVRRGILPLKKGSGRVIVANHPTLMDVGWVLARVPEAICIYKPDIGHNPFYGATARRAGYLASNGGHHLLRTAAAKLAAGHTLLVFPEGTRSRNGQLNPLKPGFVAMARLAGVPIQLVQIHCDSDLLGKERPWWKVPHLPARITVSLGPCLPPPAAETAEVVEEIEAWFRAARPAENLRRTPLEPARTPVRA